MKRIDGGKMINPKEITLQTKDTVDFMIENDNNERKAKIVAYEQTHW